MGKGGTDGGVSPAAQQLARARESDPGEAVEEPRLARAAEPKGPHRAAWVVSPQQAMRELFEAADEDASGALDRDEVARFVGLLRPSKSMTAVDVDMAMQSMDSEGSGLITFEQFSRWWMSGGARTPEERRDFAEASKLCHPRESIRAIFEMIDVDRGGTLDREEIRKAGTVLGKIFSAEELDAAMSVMDKEHTGEINFESFYAWYTSHRSGMMTDGAAARRIGLTAKLEVEKLKRTSELKATEDLMEAHARVVGESKMRVMFDEVDVDGSGVLDAEEVAAFVRKLKPTKFMGSKQKKEAMDAMDVDGSGEVSFEEFCEWWANGGSVTRGERLAAKMDSTSDELEKVLADLQKCREARSTFEDASEAVKAQGPLVLVPPLA